MSHASFIAALGRSGGGSSTPDPGDQTPLSVTFASLEDQNLTDPSSNYYGWGITAASGTDRFIFIREGDSHLFTAGSEMVRYRSVNGGPFGDRTVIRTEAGVDTRNYGGGSTSTGVHIISFARWGNGGTAFLSNRVLMSVDGGVTYSESDDLPQYIEGSTDFSPHGGLLESHTGALDLFFYCGSLDLSNYYTFSLRHLGNNNWNSTPVLIQGGDLCYEPDATELSPGKQIALVRRDESTSVKKCDVNNCTDNGDTWYSVGTLQWGAANSFAPGVAPSIYRKDDDTATVVLGYRGGTRAMISFDLPFGSAHSTGLIRFMHQYPPAMDANDIDSWYGRGIAATYENGKPVWDISSLITWYQTAESWTGSGDHVTDVVVGAMFRKKYFDYSRTNAVLTTGIDNYFALVDVHADEISGADSTDPFRIIIREAGDYTIWVVADLGANVTGTHRTITVERYNSSVVFVEDLQEVIQDETDNTFDFNDTHSFTAGQYVRVKITHDATGDITAPSLRVMVEKQ